MRLQEESTARLSMKRNKRGMILLVFGSLNVALFGVKRKTDEENKLNGKKGQDILYKGAINYFRVITWSKQLP